MNSCFWLFSLSCPLVLESNSGSGPTQCCHWLWGTQSLLVLPSTRAALQLCPAVVIAAARSPGLAHTQVMLLKSQPCLESSSDSKIRVFRSCCLFWTGGLSGKLLSCQIPSHTLNFGRRYRIQTRDVGLTSLNVSIQHYLRHFRRFQPPAQGWQTSKTSDSAIWQECCRVGRGPTASAVTSTTQQQALNPAQRVGFSSWIKNLFINPSMCAACLSCALQWQPWWWNLQRDLSAQGISFWGAGWQSISIKRNFNEIFKR